MQQGSVLVCIQTTFLTLGLLALQLRSIEGDDQVLYLWSSCSDNRHFDQGSDYQNNLYVLLSNLTSESNTNKFYNLTVGNPPNKIYGLFLCNSVYNNQVCQACITIAQGEIQRTCPSSVDAIVWYQQCMLRYANRSIFSKNDVSTFKNLDGGPVKYGQFDQQLSDTFISLFSLAVSENKNSSLVSATTVVFVASEISLSCYVDCTPDLSSSDCNRCLQTALGRFQFNGALGGVLLQPSCRLMYSFTDAGYNSSDKRLVAALSIISAVAAASLFLNTFVLCHRKQKATGKPSGLNEIESMENLHFEFESIKSATDNFSLANKLGQGGFGVVYMGKLGDGQAVAVKRLSNTSSQGYREFKTEACLAAKLQHKNLVKLFGFCSEGNEMILVYEFVPKKSLDRHLFAEKKRGTYLEWETRYNIIVGIARGLLYLHQDSRPKIIHRDLKPSNILLDAEMNPKIADFGMAKLFGVDQTQDNTSRVAGTFGYMAPEYAATGQFSVKSDIFSYGVILLEIISGQKNIISDPDVQGKTLLNYAWRLWNEGNYLNLVDSELGSSFSKAEVERCIHVGLLCIQEDPAKRPTVASVLLMLNIQPLTLPPPSSSPAFPNSLEKTAVLHRSNSFQAESVISGLSPR